MMTLREALLSRSSGTPRAFRGPDSQISMSPSTKCLSEDAVVEVANRAVLVDVGDQIAAARALIALDGIVSRMIVCPPDLPDGHRSAIALKAAAHTIVDDRWLSIALSGLAQGKLHRQVETEWVLLTSGTTGVPKLVAHDLRGLTGAFARRDDFAPTPTWATFYDIRRYGGLQIFLRAVFGNGSMVLPGRDEGFSDLLRRLGSEKVTHISGTPSHWRRVLMDPNASEIAPDYVRLSGEIADQGILDALARQYPRAKIGHAYASTEAGVGFEVNDGYAGFPASFIDEGLPGIAMKVQGETLWIKSARTARGYVGDAIVLRDPDGFVDTGDIVAQNGSRYFFAGRRGGVINIGGQKVHPEEIEAIINRLGSVRMSLVKSRRNPIMGAVVSADVVINDDGSPGRADIIRQQIEEACRAQLPPWKVPASIRFVPSLNVSAAGKLARSGIG